MIKDDLGELNITDKQKSFLVSVCNSVKHLQDEGLIFNPRVLIAQSILESGWGQSELSSNYNNLFGLKAGTLWNGKTAKFETREVVNGRETTENASFRAYEAISDSIRDYVAFISDSPYFSRALDYPNDDSKYLDVLIMGEIKYATDPEYKKLILSIISSLSLEKLFPRKQNNPVK